MVSRIGGGGRSLRVGRVGRLRIGRVLNLLTAIQWCLLNDLKVMDGGRLGEVLN
jgi:hypothetical protein